MVVVELLEDEEDWYLGAGSHCELGGPHTASHRGQLVGLVGDGVAGDGNGKLVGDFWYGVCACDSVPVDMVDWYCGADVVILMQTLGGSVISGIG